MLAFRNIPKGECVLECETLKNGTKVYIDDIVRFGIDALILSRFAITGRLGRVLDMGTGCGIIPLAAIDRNRGLHYTAIDIDETACALARRGAAESSAAERFEVIRADLKQFNSSAKYDIVTCNPPYFAAGAGRVSRSAAVGAARHEIRCTIEDIAAAGMRNLKQGGALCMSYRPARLADAICACRANRLEPKRLRLVRHRPGSEPWIVLLDARLDAGVGLEVMADLTIKDENDKYSDEAARILGIA